MPPAAVETRNSDPNEINRIHSECTRFLGHPPYRPGEVLRELVDEIGAEERADVYGSGSLLTDFEAQVASLLGKEQAVFMPSGTMCQQIALRIWADRRHTRNVAFHPRCHMEIHEQKGYQLLHGLHSVLVGSPNRLIRVDDLKGLREPLAALLLELPQRDIGGQLPTWEDLRAQVEWARERGIAVHMDGARLWESAPFYGRSYAEISALFDSVYVSLYKVLGGIAGAVLAGPADLIGEARVWQRRHGGNLVHLFPYVLSARKNLRERLDRMPSYHQKAREVAGVLTTFPQIEVTPDPPHTNMMHVFVRGNPERLVEANLAIAREEKVWLFDGFYPSPVPGYSETELSIHDAGLQLAREEIAGLVSDLLDRI